MLSLTRLSLLAVLVAVLAAGPLGMAVARDFVSTELGVETTTQQQFAEEENEHRLVSLDEVWDATARPVEYHDGHHAVSAVALSGCPTPPPEA